MQSQSRLLIPLSQRESRNSSAALWKGPCSISRNAHNNIFKPLGRPDLLQSMGSQRVRHYLVTEQRHRSKAQQWRMSDSPPEARLKKPEKIFKIMDEIKELQAPHTL